MMTPEEAQKLAKEQGHCLCNLKLKCPCITWIKFNKCECAKTSYSYTGSMDNLYQPKRRDGKFFRLMRIFNLLVWGAIGVIILKFLITNYF